MGAALAVDLRQRVVDAIAAGASRRGAAHFRVSASSAIRWAALQEQAGSVKPRTRGGRSRSPLEAHKDWLLLLNEAEPDLTLEAIVGRIGEQLGLGTTEGSVRRFFKRHKISFKKNAARSRAGAGGRG